MLNQSLCFMGVETETQRGFMTDQPPSWQLTTQTIEMVTSSQSGDQTDPWTSPSCPFSENPLHPWQSKTAHLPSPHRHLRVPIMAGTPTREAVLQSSCLMALEHCPPHLLQNTPSSHLRPDLMGCQAVGALSATSTHVDPSPNH